MSGNSRIIGKAAVAATLALCLGLSAAPAQAAGCGGTAYWDWHYEGRALGLSDYVPFVGRYWNDQISSIRIRAGIWRFYRDAGFRGDFLELGPGGYSFSNGDQWNDQISSFRCVRPTN